MGRGMGGSSNIDRAFFVHEKAVCDSTNIGKGTRIWGLSHVLAGAVIGRDCNIGEHVFIENKVVIGNQCTIKNGVAIWDCVTLEDGVFVGPYAVFTNDLKPRAFLKRGGTHFLPTLLKRGATVGANAVIVCGVVVGQYAMIGSGAVVTRDVPAHALVVGNPAKIIGRICYCGDRLDAQDFCKACNKALARNSEQAVIEAVNHA